MTLALKDCLDFQRQSGMLEKKPLNRPVSWRWNCAQGTGSWRQHAEQWRQHWEPEGMHSRGYSWDCALGMSPAAAASNHDLRFRGPNLCGQC